MEHAPFTLGAWQVLQLLAFLVVGLLCTPSALDRESYDCKTCVQLVGPQYGIKSCSSPGSPGRQQGAQAALSLSAPWSGHLPCHPPPFLPVGLSLFFCCCHLSDSLLLPCPGGTPQAGPWLGTFPEPCWGAQEACSILPWPRFSRAPQM